MSRKTLIRLLLLPILIYFIYLFGWQLGERQANQKPFIYEAF
jgi:hypothetical protein